ncbi:preprotein translocase subunit SecY [Elizabethkingia meningoseptica]|uniref:Protein translocase subunit SecY n=1 Tax=Elizabethkingia meningoseptica TaxID=238 RepID=A0A1V3U048_ELIME|nr:MULTISPECIES: preprotein translocase subunit SecY [Elizabethkingia]AQX04694.1 preprotein translocase subunit SecY [Elizabethkingia meningoseptica]AQX12157.1 preprotein translocase subunit SecY [Elizabethkingia meningoseptica]AQX46736.1 preprotein translocase subunit SecY [Elizabethkingia meningoseptica]EOR31291.1 Preprotein translocase secY subunit [Elizabethkingia meningoseptica ATCC 13253 = NBRC 12535]KUY19250.1 preprotein translocase subunit SecY [Elizabethkingia meningoseptica]
MKGFIQTLKNIWSLEELRNKLVFTFTLILVYRFASYISLPAINMAEVGNLLQVYQNQGGSKQASGLLGLLSSFTGGAFSRASIMALGIMPYISASIIVQLMGMAIPYLQKLQKDGESGRKTLNQITRWLTIGVCLVQAPSYLGSITGLFLPYSQFSSAYYIDPNSIMFWLPSIVILVTGSIFAMWLGEKITDKGIGNGISILIMVGILADLPMAFIHEFQTQTGKGGLGTIIILVEVLFWLLVILLAIILSVAVRKIPIQYVSRAQARGGVSRNLMEGARQWIPLKVNAAGVMPIIFAQALMFVPGLLTKVDETNTFLAGFKNVFSWQYNVLFAILIIIFSFFYTAITIPVNQMADDLKRNGGLIPKVRPGKETADYLDDILSKITLPGAIFLSIFAVLPAIVHGTVVQTDRFALFFGGTSLLILVGVILDTVQQINTYLLNHHYDGLMQSKLSRNPNL